jgi:hypothetical protein
MNGDTWDIILQIGIFVIAGALAIFMVVRQVRKGQGCCDSSPDCPARRIRDKAKDLRRK